MCHNTYQLYDITHWLISHGLSQPIHLLFPKYCFSKLEIRFKISTLFDDALLEPFEEKFYSLVV